VAIDGVGEQVGLAAEVRATVEGNDDVPLAEAGLLGGGVRAVSAAQILHPQGYPRPLQPGGPALCRRHGFQDQPARGHPPQAPRRDPPGDVVGVPPALRVFD
jgi:hypothetical protein